MQNHIMETQHRGHIKHSIFVGVDETQIKQFCFRSYCVNSLILSIIRKTNPSDQSQIRFKIPIKYDYFKRLFTFRQSETIVIVCSLYNVFLTVIRMRIVCIYVNAC